MPQFLSAFLAIGLGFIVIFLILSFFISALALYLGVKFAKSEYATFLNSIKTLVLVFVVQIVLTFITHFLSFQNQNVPSGLVHSLLSLVGFFLSILILFVPLYIIKKIFSLTVWGTIKAALITALISGTLHGIALVILTMTSLGVMFKTVNLSGLTPTIKVETQAPSQNAPVTSPTETGTTPPASDADQKPRLPKLPTESATPAVESTAEGKPCEKHSNCNEVDELCISGTCKSLNEIKEMFGSTDDPSFDPCKTRPCPNCASGFQQLISVNYSNNTVHLSANACEDCLFASSCKTGFKCKQGLCVDIMANPTCTLSMNCGTGYKCENKLCVKEATSVPSSPSPTQSAPSTPPTSAPVSNSASDPESLKRDDEAISSLDLLISMIKFSDLPASVENGKKTPCLSDDQFGLTKKIFSVEGQSCNTSLFKLLKNGIALFVGIVNPSKANVDTRMLSNLSSMTAQDLKALLGPVNSLTPSENMAYAVVFEFPATYQP